MAVNDNLDKVPPKSGTTGVPPTSVTGLPGHKGQKSGHPAKSGTGGNPNWQPEIWHCEEVLKLMRCHTDGSLWMPSCTDVGYSEKLQAWQLCVNQSTWWNIVHTAEYWCSRLLLHYDWFSFFEPTFSGLWPLEFMPDAQRQTYINLTVCQLF